MLDRLICMLCDVDSLYKVKITVYLAGKDSPYTNNNLRPGYHLQHNTGRHYTCSATTCTSHCPSVSMATRDAARKPQLPQGIRKSLQQKSWGTVKCLNVKNGYGFINRNESKDAVYVHQKSIKGNNPRKNLRRFGDGEIVEFDKECR